MRIAPFFIAFLLAFLVGCGSDSRVLITGSNGSEQPGTDGTQEEVLAAFAGASFASLNQMAVGQIAEGESIVGSNRVSFTNDTVTWVQGDLVESGTYSLNSDGAHVAQFPDREVVFDAYGGDITWNSERYLRAAESQFDSQESLVAYFDGTRYNTVDQFDVGESVSGELVMGYWSMQFSSAEARWSVQDTVTAGNYGYLNDSEFGINLHSRQYNVVVLADGNLLIDSKIYERAIVSQFDSQDTLIEFLTGGTYKSVEQKPATQPIDGVVALGYWFVDFLENTITWTYSGLSEAGTIEYLDNSSFTATFADQRYVVSVENEDIIFDGTRYERVVGQ